MINNINIYNDTPAWELALAVKDEKTKNIEKIVKGNPQLLNYQEPKYGETLLLWAVGMEKYKSAEALLKCGADPNINYVGHKHDIIETGTSPLMHSIRCGIEKTKALVEGGADINYKTKSGYTAAIVALQAVGPTTMQEMMQYAYYLIVEKNKSK